MMGIREFTKSGAFVVIIFALVIVLMPFGIEQIGEATDLFKFPATKTISGWFMVRSRIPRDHLVFKPVDWDRYRHDLEYFSNWTENQDAVAISLPSREVVIMVEEEEKKPDHRIWHVPVVSCTAGNEVGRAASARRPGYVFISGFDHPYEEGAVIAPSKGLCGYEIVCIGERAVWFRVVSDDEGEAPMGIVKFPEFTRVEGESLVKGNRRFFVRDAFPLASGGWLMIDSFMPPDEVLFKILDEKHRVVATILCVVIGEKGGR